MTKTQFIVRHIPTGLFISGRKYTVCLDNLDRARLYGRRCDAGNSINEYLHRSRHRGNGLDRSQFETLPAKIQISFE